MLTKVLQTSNLIKDTQMKKLKVIISGGGTGGHIFPAISIAQAIKKRFPTAEILFVGAEGRMEMERVPDAGFEIVGLPVSGFYRTKMWRNIRVLWRLQKSLFKAKKVIRKFKPHIAIGVGGYASGPLLKIAAARNIPTLIQEQNSYPGITNKLLAQKASVICVAYPDMDKYFPKDRIVLTGNPCRENILEDVSKDEAAKYFNLDPNKKTILVLGGSLGSRTLNWSLQQSLNLIADSGVQLIWQSGEFYFHELFLEIPNRTDSKDVRLHAFLKRMDLAYKMADLVISRAGASSISELSLLGKPAILVPSPNVAEDHQTKNAMTLVKNEAAILITDDEAIERLVPKAIETVFDDNKLKLLSDNILKLAQKDSANRIVDEMVNILKDKLSKEREN